MKVTNNKIGNTPAQVETGKSAKSEAGKAIAGEAAQAGALNAKANVKGSVNVNVSERAQMMQKAKEIASKPMTVDEAKVARLQKLIDEGKYKVDANSIADRLVDDHLQIPD